MSDNPTPACKVCKGRGTVPWYYGTNQLVVLDTVPGMPHNKPCPACTATTT